MRIQLEATKLAGIRAAIAANPDRSCGNIAAEFAVSTRTVLKRQVEYWRDRALKAERP